MVKIVEEQPHLCHLSFFCCGEQTRHSLRKTEHSFPSMRLLWMLVLQVSLNLISQKRNLVFSIELP